MTEQGACTGEGKVFERIYENYQDLNRKMAGEMDLATMHGTLTGNYREEMWLSFFRSIIPMKYSLAQGVIIMDSFGNISREVDIAVYDEQYTPYVFRYNTLKMIPIEAVAVVIECKSRKYDPGQLKKWSKCIANLKPNPFGIARMAMGYAMSLTNKMQTRTRPVRILAAMRKAEQEKTFKNWRIDLKDAFDFMLFEQKESDEKYQQFTLQVNNEKKSLAWWGDELNKSGAVCAENKSAEAVTDSNQAAPRLEVQHLTESAVKSYIAAYGLEDEKKLSSLQWLEANKGKLNFIEENEKFRIDNTLEDLRIKGNDLLTLNLQLNQLLMLLNNPMLFPHFAYAKRFQDVAK